MQYSKKMVKKMSVSHPTAIRKCKNCDVYHRNGKCPKK